MGGARCLYPPLEPSHKEVLWEGWIRSHPPGAKGCSGRRECQHQGQLPAWLFRSVLAVAGTPSWGHVESASGSGARRAEGWDGVGGGPGSAFTGCLPPRGSRTTAPTSNAGPPAPAPPGRSASAGTPRPRGRPSTIAAQVLAPTPHSCVYPRACASCCFSSEESVSYSAQLEKGRTGRWRAVLLVTEAKALCGLGGEVKCRGGGLARRLEGPSWETPEAVLST